MTGLFMSQVVFGIINTEVADGWYYHCRMINNFDPMVFGIFQARHTSGEVLCDNEKYIIFTIFRS